MSKSTQKNKYNPHVVDRLREKYGVSKRFITMSLKGTRESEVSDSINIDYPVMDKAVTEAIKNALANL